MALHMEKDDQEKHIQLDLIKKLREHLKRLRSEETHQISMSSYIKDTLETVKNQRRLVEDLKKVINANSNKIKVKTLVNYEENTIKLSEKNIWSAMMLHLKKISKTYNKEQKAIVSLKKCLRKDQSMDITQASCSSSQYKSQDVETRKDQAMDITQASCSSSQYRSQEAETSFLDESAEDDDELCFEKGYTKEYLAEQIKIMIKTVLNNDSDDDDDSNMCATIAKFQDSSKAYAQRMYITKYVSNRFPVFFISDVLKAKNHICHDELICHDLFVINNITFNNVCIRGSVIEAEEVDFKFLVDDGTGSVLCIVDCDTVAINTSDFPVMENCGFNVSHKAINDLWEIEIGDIVQITGRCDVYKKKVNLFVKKICKEDPFSLSKECRYVEYVKSLYKMYKNKWLKFS